ncbi:glycosyltransferase family 39 protein, partial [Vibrio parahaemolyticus]|uniref:glycosyltransferase family 39 protein n=1 Tax=Vibrio parahaemolyticus TaxID=670 RepID=UPI002111A08F
AGAQRLGLGYVDHPPLAPWLLAACAALLGEGRLAIRLLPALCFAGTVLLAGRIAQRLGAGHFGQTLAGLSVALMPVLLVIFSFYS